MKGSAISNIKFDPTKQKLVKCAGCQKEMIVKKFSGNDQRCDDCNNLGKKSPPKQQPIAKKTLSTPKAEVQQVAEVAKTTSSNEFLRRMNELGFEFAPSQHAWKKKYPLDGGGFGTVYVYLRQGVAGGSSELDYFCYIEQRAISLSDDFTKKMGQEAAGDCQMLVDEFSTVVTRESRLDYRKCDKCGMQTYGFLVDNKSGRLLCYGVNTNNCGKKQMNNLGAEAEL